MYRHTPYSEILQRVQECEDEQNLYHKFHDKFLKCIADNNEECVRIFLDSPYADELVSRTCKKQAYLEVSEEFIAFDQPVLFEVIEYGHLEILRLLLEHGADATAKNGLGISAVEFAKKYRDIQKSEVVALLEEYIETEEEEEEEPLGSKNFSSLVSRI